MLDFFIALFGGAYYAGKYIHDKSVSDAADIRNKAMLNSIQSDYDRFINRMTDEALEQRMKQDVYRGKYKELIEKVTNEVFAKAAAKGINLLDDQCRAFEMVKVYPDYRLLIAMASVEKLPRSVAMFGISRPMRGELWGVHAIFMDWLDKELQSHGVEPMVFQSELQQSMSVTGVKVYARNAQMCHGKFGWFSARMFL